MTITKTSKINLLGKCVGRTLDGFFTGLAMISKHSPLANMERFGLEVLKNISYGNLGEYTTLDIYRPKIRDEFLPVVISLFLRRSRRCSATTAMMIIIYKFIEYSIDPAPL